MKARFSPRWLTPRYWHNWVLLLGGYALTLLPWSLRLRTGALIGEVMRLILPKRRRIARANIGACAAHIYPEHPERAALLERQHFRSMGMALAEASTAWWGRRAFVEKRLSSTVQGQEVVDRHQKQGRGILLLPLHYSFIELLPSLLRQPWPLTQIPRPHNNPLVEYMIRNGRQRWLSSSAAKDNPWDMLSVLRAGGICIYFADQDYGRRSSVFAPFFGLQASTTVLGRRLAQRAGAAAVLLEMQRRDGAYFSRFHAFDEYLQADTDAEATALLNARFETFIRKAPEQWFWLHRRFKTRPPGGEHIYPGSLAKR